MVQSHGFRRKTRTLLRKGYGKKGLPGISKNLQVFKKGEHVDCVINSSVHKGMPHKTYHGRTGKIVVVNETTITVLFLVRVGNKVEERAINMRAEHLRKSRCNLWLIKRQKMINELRETAKSERTSFIVPKIKPQGPRKSFYLNLSEYVPEEVSFKTFNKLY
ncbi:uncharacterized protein [Lepeophtheirus salmonis]|uniref:uncharacterized protein n=1 Tax=Lepeophtheirus salmonis TaxID=72036 RepID=UPI001AE8D6DB|nr:60S ribosomal protein L21-1-like [Lepeophtheirus salmonis]